MRRIIDDEVKYRIERVPGVAALDVWGGLAREIHVDLDPDKLKALEIPLDTVMGRIRTANVTLAAGTIETGNYEVTLRTPGEYTNLDELRDTTVAVRQGAAGAPERRGRRRRRVAEGHPHRPRQRPARRAPLRQQAVRHEHRRRGPARAQGGGRHQPGHPADTPDAHHRHLRLHPALDHQRRHLGPVTAACSPCSCCWCSCATCRSTAIIAVAIPVSIVATFALIYFCGFTLNLMTLGGLALGVGMLVDNAIVVLENIYRLREGGMPREEAAVRGAQEVTAAIIASTLTTLVVFLPLVFVRGMAGVMFKQLAYVVSFALLCSLGVALTLVPMLASRFVHTTSLERVEHETLWHRVYRADGHVLRRPGARLQGAAALGAAATGSMVVVTAARPAGRQPGARAADRRGADAADGRGRGPRRRRDGGRHAAGPGGRAPCRTIEAIVAARGAGGQERGRPARRQRQLPASCASRWCRSAERTRSSEEIAGALRKALAGIPGATIRTRAGQGLFLLRRLSGGSERVEVEIRGYDLRDRRPLAAEGQGLVEQVPGVTDARFSRESGAPERLISVDRGKAEAHEGDRAPGRRHAPDRRRRHARRQLPRGRRRVRHPRQAQERRAALPARDPRPDPHQRRRPARRPAQRRLRQVADRLRPASTT